ncbi:hypothetical protein BJ875DRAFT_388665 [Amylocarpus encephaloides]|uniref:BRCT domain-containing protein n=1 Tax=Amylocarpus encephaloides TaxID=45428 RepID=A0A9P7Y8G4_9HELO|nr:hypothetical protein BJ875DRAFT_388665 [Amylocarpus encephaloides]
MAPSKNLSSKNSSLSKTTLTSPLKKEKKSSSQKQIFIGKEIAISGSFTNCDKPAPHNQIAGWIRAHGGTFVEEVSPNTTHLICSLPDFKSKPKQVKRALSLGRSCAIVSFDWLVDCLIRVKKTCRPVKPYSLKDVVKRLNKVRLEAEKLESQFKAAVETALNFSPLRCNAVYYDDTGFEYKVELRRESREEKIVREKYTLFIFQSICKPHTHMFGAKYTSSKHRHTSYHRESSSPRLFHEAFDDFKVFFKDKTGLEWDHRLEEQGNTEKFIYRPPAAGKAVGQLPYGYVRPAPKVVYRKPTVEDAEEEAEEDGHVEIEEWKPAEEGGKGNPGN